MVSRELGLGSRLVDRGDGIVPRRARSALAQPQRPRRASRPRLPRCSSNTASSRSRRRSSSVRRPHRLRRDDARRLQDGAQEQLAALGRQVSYPVLEVEGRRTTASSRRGDRRRPGRRRRRLVEEGRGAGSGQTGAREGARRSRSAIRPRHQRSGGVHLRAIRHPRLQVLPRTGRGSPRTGRRRGRRAERVREVQRRRRPALGVGEPEPQRAPRREARRRAVLRVRAASLRPTARWSSCSTTRTTRWPRCRRKSRSCAACTGAARGST